MGIVQSLVLFSGTSLGVFVNEVYFSPIPSIVDLTSAKRIGEWDDYY